MSSCPLSYALNFPREPKFQSSCLYVVGGLYGNVFALNEILAMADAEGADIVFNGDIHWFDAEAKSFCQIEREIEKRGLMAINGNIEFGLASGQNGCGCFYPSCTDDGTVERSNLIHARLSRLVKEERAQNLEIFKKRAKCELVSVGGANIAITHGDEKFLAGWGCSRENLSQKARQDELKLWFKKRKFDVLACTHTCAPVAIALDSGVVINNGAAGMPNFSGKLYGLITRIAIVPSKEAIYRARRGEIYIEALPVRYDAAEFLKWFDQIWQAQSPAAISYRGRIANGSEGEIRDAMLGGFENINGKI